MKLRRAVLIALLLLLAVWLGSELLVNFVVTSFNPVGKGGPYVVSQAAADLHGSLFVADLHADPLLWKRDLRKRGGIGHVDLPRLVEGGVGLMVFGLVTKTPRGMNYEANAGDSDNITLLAVAQRWPFRTWRSLMERALYQAEKLDRLVAASDGVLMWVRTREDLEELVRRRERGEAVIGALLGLEGAHALEGDLSNLDRLHTAGVRMLGLAHFFDNEVAGSAHGLEKGGLTDFGRRVVHRAGELGMAIDIAHASVPAMREALARAKGPVISSHTGVQGTCGGSRNLSDDDLIALAVTGGVAGIGLFEGAVCGDDIRATADAIVYAIGVAGVDHVGLGSDFDGAVATPVDVSGMALVTEELLLRGLAVEEIRKVMGGNVVRVLRQTLPR